MAKAAKRFLMLYVADHPGTPGLVEELVATRGDVRLARASDVDSAIKTALARIPDLILIDIDLPGTSALEFMKRLRAERRTQAAPILALGLAAAPDVVVKFLEAGFFAYLAKPLTAQPFLEAVGYALEFVALERAEQ